MRVCSHCGKANQPTRKYCIRCGKSLLKSTSTKPAPVAREPTPEIPETGRVTTGRATRAASEASGSDSPTTTDDAWVKPSEISRDRVRTSDARRGKTEMEKAMEAFSRADTVGLEEEGSGVVETRMLRASEVKELLEGPEEPRPPAPAAPAEPAPAPPTSEVPPAQVAPPSPAAPVTPEPEPTPSTKAEAEILGTKSAFAAPSEAEADPSLQPHVSGSPVPSDLSEEFTSSRYDDVAAEPPAEPIVQPAKPTGEEVGLEYELPEEPKMVPTPESGMESVPAAILATPCPNCGTLVTHDGFDYPPEIYSAMGQVRLKQARYFVVQAKYVDAKKVVDTARLLFQKANDENGLKELEKLIGSIKERG
ncbi:MAG: zinc-ribbon domain-containing protein [Candidatus Thorarchaeota archaeon]|nr:MAG: zinc-ribbon domain-containing protein [Candidatus Thorarchaeota archaeon]